MLSMIYYRKMIVVSVIWLGPVPVDEGSRGWGWELVTGASGENVQ